MSDPNCIFCKIIGGDIPSLEIYNTEHVFGFMDINPLSEGHCLFIPKKHAVKIHETDNEALSEILIAIKKVAKAMDIQQYNILQNNGELAHQEVKHTHFHLIPKPNPNDGLGISWKPIEGSDQEKMANKIKSSLE